MKQFLLVAALFYAGVSVGQNDPCIKSRWIAVKNNEENKVLFDKTYSILKTIKLNVEAGKMEVYYEGKNARNRGEWYPIPYEEHIVNEETGDTIYTEYRADYFEIRIQSDIPLTDEYGDPMIFTHSDGTQSYLYPPAEVHVIDLDRITEIRIKEERVQNAEGDYFFQPTGVSFYMDYGYLGGRELFWISVNELFTSTAEIEAYPWYPFIQNRNYSGFQYMQVACEDAIIRY